MRGRSLIGIMVWFAALSAGVAVEAEDDVARLMALMTGTFDSAAQVDGEIAAGVALEQRHQRHRLLYAPIDAPQVGKYVLFRQDLSDGHPPAPGLAVFEPDGDGVRMWLRRIPDADAFTDLHRRPELWPKVTFDPAYGGKCPFHWHATGDGFLGTLAGGRCEIVSNTGNNMAFEARWNLTRKGLSIVDNTYDGTGRLISGRADRVATRYDRTPP